MKIDDECFFVSTKDVVTIKLGVFFSVDFPRDYYSCQYVLSS